MDIEKQIVQRIEQSQRKEEQRERSLLETKKMISERKREKRIHTERAGYDKQQEVRKKENET